MCLFDADLNDIAFGDRMLAAFKLKRAMTGDDDPRFFALEMTLQAQAMTRGNLDDFYEKPACFKDVLERTPRPYFRRIRKNAHRFDGMAVSSPSLVVAPSSSVAEAEPVMSDPKTSSNDLDSEGASMMIA